MADRNDIRFANNADAYFRASVLDADDVPRDLTGATFEIDFRASATDDAEVFTLTSGNGRVVLANDPTTGVFYMRIPKTVADALDPGTLVYDARMTIAGIVERITFGSARVEQGVTR